MADALIPPPNSTIKIRENWLTRAPKSIALPLTFLMGVLLYLATYTYLNGKLGADQWRVSLVE